jgi:hypothetical protein
MLRCVRPSRPKRYLPEAIGSFSALIKSECTFCAEMIALVQREHKETNGLISKIVWEAAWVQLAVRPDRTRASCVRSTHII